MPSWNYMKLTHLQCQICCWISWWLCSARGLIFREELGLKSFTAKKQENHVKTAILIFDRMSKMDFAKCHNWMTLILTSNETLKGMIGCLNFAEINQITSISSVKSIFTASLERWHTGLLLFYSEFRKFRCQKVNWIRCEWWTGQISSWNEISEHWI